MNSVYVGIWSIIPPIVSIIFVLIFKEIVSSLLIGISVGTIIYSIFSQIGMGNALNFVVSLLNDNISSGASVILFTCLLGAISEIMSSSGSALRCANWARKRIKSPVSSQLLSIFLSFVCAIDDAFSSLTVGNIMRPICDKNKICRAKLAYLIDMTASQLCLIMPFSSWAAPIMSCMSCDNAMEYFFKSIPFNFYAIFSIVSAVAFSFSKKNLGLMSKFQNNVLQGNDISKVDEPEDKIIENEKENKSGVLDLILPIIILIVVTVFMILETSGFFSTNNKNFSLILRKANMDLSLTIGSFASIITCLAIFVPKKMSFEKFMSSVFKGIESVTPTLVMLVLAWSISSICRDYLMIGEYIKSVIGSANVAQEFIPLVSFLLASFLSFSMGSSWGTFMLLIPILFSALSEASNSILVLSISAILSGSVAGVNCSPISNSGMIASMGAGCKHIDHISSQTPYALFTMSISAISFLVYPFTNLLTAYMFSTLSIILFVYFLNKSG